MSKMNLEDDQTTSSPEPTRPNKVNRKIFKDNPEAGSMSGFDTNVEDIEITAPVKTRSKKSKTDELVSVEESDGATKTGKPKKVGHGKWVWLGILILLVITAIGVSIGIGSAMKERRAAEETQKIERATVQFLMAEEDQKSGNLELALKRLEYILKVYPEFPGLTEKLTEVMLAYSLTQMEISTPTGNPDPAFTPVPTKDTSNLSVLLAQAQSQFAQAPNTPDQFSCRNINSNERDRGPWEALLITVNQLRNIDPSYEPLKVDGLYYFALRYNGITNIVAGNLEQGLYYFALAEKIAPLDNEAEGYRNMAKMYQAAGYWYEVNWQKAAEGLYPVYQNYPSMVDYSCQTAKQRYVDSLEGVGDNLMMAYDYCDAATQYQNAKNILTDDGLPQKIQQAQEFCANPPATPTPTLDPNVPTPTPGPTNAP